MSSTLASAFASPSAGDPELAHDDRLDEARDGGRAEFDDSIGRVHGARTFYGAIDNTANAVPGDRPFEDLTSREHG